MKKVDGFTDLVRKSLGKALAEADSSCGFMRSNNARTYDGNPGGSVAGRGPEPFPGFDFPPRAAIFGSVWRQGRVDQLVHKTVTLSGELGTRV